MAPRRMIPSGFLIFVLKVKTCTMAGGTVGTTTYDSQWQNNWDGDLDYNIPSGRSLSTIKSLHSNDKVDRLSNFGYSEFCHVEPTPSTTPVPTTKVPATPAPIII